MLSLGINKVTSQLTFAGRIMKYSFATCGNDKASMGRSLDKENPTRCSVSGGKPNRCIIFPANVSMVAEALERRNKDR